MLDTMIGIMSPNFPIRVLRIDDLNRNETYSQFFKSGEKLNDKLKLDIF
jgi:hypothetical protein